MIEHYLDGNRVYPSKSEKIQITSENAILTRSGSYTLEVKFPLEIFDNREFFGNLDRIDVTKQRVTWDIEIKNNGATIILGTATLVKATEKEVSVQYLAGNSQVNFWENAEKTYIDEYDYNTNEEGKDRVDVWASDYSAHWIYGYGGPTRSGKWGNGGFSQTGKKKSISELYFFYKENPYKYVKADDLFFGVKGEFCFANVYDEDYDWSEDDTWKAKHGISVGNGITYGQMVFSMAEVAHGMTMWANCVMPHLLFVIKQIIQKRGYTIERNDIMYNRYVEDLYIASPRLSLKIADALPHWTVKEFFTQIENFFNCTLIFDEEKRTCSFVQNTTILEAEKIKIEEIIEEHEEEISNEESSEANIFSSNIKYKDIGKEGAIRCDDATRKKYKTIFGEGLDDLIDKAKRVPKPEWNFYRDKNLKGYSYGWNGREMLPIDYLCSLHRGSEEDFELKVVPARISHRYYPTGEYDHAEGYRYALIPMAVLTMSNGWKGWRYYEGNLIEEVLGQIQGEGDGTKEDFLPVFFYEGHRRSSYDGKAHYTAKFSAPNNDATIINGPYQEDFGHAVLVGDQYTGKYWNNYFEENTRKNQSLTLVPGHTDRYHGKVFEGNPKINMESELQIGFRMIEPPNPRAVFVIHNKEYLASKIEYEIDEDGIIPLMKGYFREVMR